MDAEDVLNLFLLPVRSWFQRTLGQPTPAQQQGWPAIAAGKNTLILAPTGSGKTLAAFLACLDSLWRQPDLPRGVRVLYISPLKALNNDIQRNLQVPLQGVADSARELQFSLPSLETAVRTGDTPTSERQRQVRRPPHVLITTPESLHLLLTSRARETLRGVTHVIVDEIHALCTNKRGVFLSLLLERLQAINPRPFVRIGLSATQRPLSEVARYLGGYEQDAQGNWQPRPVHLVDAGMRKQLDLQVVCPVEQFGPLPEKSIWPSIYRLLGDQIRSHRSTLVFANNRRSVERITAFLNEEEEIARAHHGSVALEVRQETEQALKEGRLPAVVATASLEMGIDMGAVDLVCQVESPGNVARALQRVGRAGHIVGQHSKGRLIPKTNQDLLEQAVLAREMAAGRVEEIRLPTNCLDVLAQQIVALVALENWTVPELYQLIRRSTPYHQLTPDALESVLEMVAGRFRLPRPNATPAKEGGTPRVTRGNQLEALQPRISWDRIHNRLHALPGTQQTALLGGGTIPDTGQFAAVTGNGVRIGELDEEFIWERRVGDAFLLGTSAWQITQIEDDRVHVSPAEGAPAIVPFWRGEGLGRSHDLGVAMGQFLLELAARIDAPDCLEWLQKDYFLDRRAAYSLRHHVFRQLANGSALPTHRTVVIEASRDQLGDWQVILLSPLGSRLHLGLRLALEAVLTRRLGYRPQCLHHDDGLLIRLTESEDPLLDLLQDLTAENVEDLILSELAESALFALRFRQNAARALLMPRGKPGQRAPLWLQRLRGRDLLQVARQHPDFPIVVETFRECLHDHLDVARLQQWLREIQDGTIQLHFQRRELPSPFAASLAFSFTASMMYQYDGVEPEREKNAPSMDRQLLQQLLTPEQYRHLLDPRAIQQIERRLRRAGQLPRNVNEMAEWLRRLGDLGLAELEGPMAGFLDTLQAEGRATLIDLEGVKDPARWVLAEELRLYQDAFGQNRNDAHPAALEILHRFLETHALVSLEDIVTRYPFERSWTEQQLKFWETAGRAVAVPPNADGEPMQWSAPENLEQVQRGTLGLLRREVVTCSAPHFQEFLLRWQGAHPETHRGGIDGVAEALTRLQGLPLATDLWEETVLPVRVPGYQSRWLDECIAGGSFLWVACGDPFASGQLAFLDAEYQAEFEVPTHPHEAPLSELAQQIRGILQTRGAAFVPELASSSGQKPSVVRQALVELLERSQVTNDRFDVLRRGKNALLANPTERETGPEMRRPGVRPRTVVARRNAASPEGRWAAIRWAQSHPRESQTIQASMRLLHRYGVVARELAQLDPWMPPWRVLYEVLDRLEMTGQVRRGYFVEGLSGAQFALPEAVRMLQEQQLPSTQNAPVLLLHSLDPANLYGSSAPFDIPLLDGGARSFSRRAGNWLVLRSGKPVLLIEGQGKRLTALPSASADDMRLAVQTLPSLCQPKGKVQHKLTVEEWNTQPPTLSPAREWLEAAGFVRDYQGMTLYAVWK